MSISVEHAGVEIKYREDSDEWVVIGHNYSSPKLSNCRKKIDEFGRDIRRLDNVRLIKVGHSAPVFMEATTIAEDGRNVFVVKREGNRTSRGKERISDLIADTPEHRAVLDEVKEWQDEADVLSKRARDAIAALPRVTPSDLRPEAS